MPIGCRSALLAGAGVGAVGNGDLVLGGLVGVGSLLGGHSNTAILGSLDTNGLGLRIQVRTSDWIYVVSIETICTLVLAKPEY